MIKTISCLALSAVLAWPFGLVADSIDDDHFDGLQLIEKDSRGAIYGNPNADWSSYSKIMLDDAEVSFRKNWLRDQNRNRSLSMRVSDRDVERIKNDLANLFNEVFLEELTENGGYEVVSEAASDVMRISPKIADLDVYAPETNWSGGANRSYTDSSGKMTLKLEIYDAVTGDLIAAANDRREARHRGYMEWTTSISNRSDARQMLRQWAIGLRERLQEASAPDPD